jgi:hypothetical protein
MWGGIDQQLYGIDGGRSAMCRPGVLSIADEMIEWRYALLVSPKMARLRHAGGHRKCPLIG